MKSRVDIFRPLAAATRGCRPASATSIFRRNDKCGGQRSSDDDDSFVVSVPPGDWPPHKDTLGSAASDSTSTNGKGRLKASVPLPAGTTTSSGEDGKTGSSPSGSPLGSRRTTAVKAAAPPSYYKIELDPENDQLQLMAGDDASVQFTPEIHNQQLQVANASHELSESIRRLSNKNGIVRASPIAKDNSSKESPSKSKEQHGRHQSQQRWTISGHGEIVAVPPSPSQVSMTHSKPSSHPGYSLDGEDISIPPMLVKADSSSTSSSASTRSGHPLLTESFVREEGAEVISLESPPRMTRSIMYPKSLFQDSVSSRSSSPSTDTHCMQKLSRTSCGGHGGRRARRLGSNGSDRAENQARGCGNGGCGARFDFFGTVLDMFSLSGPCCRSEEGVGTAPVPVEAVLVR